MAKTPQSVEDVVRSGLCTGCGLCESIAGRDRVEMGLGIEGHMRPLVRQPLPLIVQRRIMDVCPGANLEGPGRTDAPTFEPLWGPIRTVNRSWASEEEVRFHGAGGGTLTALASYMLDSGEVEAVLHVKADPERPWLTRSTISRSTMRMPRLVKRISGGTAATTTATWPGTVPTPNSITTGTR